MGNVTEIQLAEALKEDRHYIMNELTKVVFPIIEKLDNMVEATIKMEAAQESMEKRFQSHMDEEEKDRSSIVRNLEDINKKLDNKEDKATNWRYLVVLATIGAIAIGFLWLQIESLQENQKELKEGQLEQKSMIDRVLWTLEQKIN